MLRMASVSTLVGCEDRVSRVERVVSVGVTDGSSLVLAVLRVRILFVRCTGLLGCTAYGGVVPSAV